MGEFWMEQMRRTQVALLTGLVVLTLSAGYVSAANTVESTAEAQQQAVTDTAKTKTIDARKIEAAAESVDRAVPHPLLHWDRVEKQPKETKRSDRPLVVVHNAVPIIITAADIDAQAKLKHRSDVRSGAQSIGETTAAVPVNPTNNREGVAASPVVPVKPSVPPQPTLSSQPGATEPSVAKPVPVQQPVAGALPAGRMNVVELPPIQPVGQVTAHREIIEALPPIEPVPAVRAAVAARQSDIVELPPIRPVRTSK